MSNSKSNTAKRVLTTGSIVAGSIFAVSASTLEINTFSSEELGNGSEIRAKLLDNNKMPVNSIELACGEGTCGSHDTKAATTTTDEAVEATESNTDKAAEMKCGEGKCGEKAATDATEAVEAIDAVEAATDKATEASCGGKTDKATEASCGGK